MAFPGKVPAEALSYIKVGTHATRAKVAAQFRDAPIGTIYISAPAVGGTALIYVKLTESGGASGTSTDWQKITTSAAD
jgi:hypothetical protein